ncbi:RNA-directed DNA polymerase (Reverse transcriptase), partial [Trifolium medium]|nr:RNA-directed DNA polymerase (Reverse transcriptase) [Trifolium medium]
MVRGKEGVSSNLSKGGGVGPKGDKQAQFDKRRNGIRDRGFTHLSYPELLERKQKGLCFKCGGAFHPMHQCPDKQLRVLVLDDDEVEDMEAQIIAVEVDESEEEEKGELS